MHIIELKIYKFLQEVAKGSYKIPQELLAKFGDETKSALKKQFEREERSFKLSMSNVGRPLCQLKMEKQHGSVNPDGIVRFLFGDLVEDVLLFLLYASGINILAEQKYTSLEIEGRQLGGTLDIILDLGRGPEVYDIKSASDFAFKSKSNMTFKEFLKQDSFGYCSQLFGYAEAEKILPGGFIFNNKSSGEISVLAVPEHFEELKQEALDKAKYNLLNIDTPFKREFDDIEETFNKKKTGNKILGTVCEFCDFKFKCWDNLTIRPQINSSSKNPKMLYYTKINEAM